MYRIVGCVHAGPFAFDEWQLTGDLAGALEAYLSVCADLTTRLARTRTAVVPVDEDVDADSPAVHLAGETVARPINAHTTDCTC